MNVHEFQAKQILAKYGVPIPEGKKASSVEEATRIAQSLRTDICVVKAQIHSGGRGKGGGVKVSKDIDSVAKNAHSILGMQLVTKQTGPQGQKVKKLLVEECVDIKKELYCSLLVDRENKGIILLASREGGMDIEDVGEKYPEKILKIFIDPVIGLLPCQANELAFGLKINEINPALIKPAAAVFISLYQAFVGQDCSLIEINPLVLTRDSKVIALDAKIILDDNAIFRHKENLEMRDTDEEDPLEVEASAEGLNYIKLDGDIGCMVNGAGLAMGTMDIIKSFGGEPANFLDVGGTANQANIEKALKLITKDQNVKCVLINIFGGIVRCDMVAAGIIAAFKNIKVKIPVVIRLEGTNSKEAHDLMKESGINNLFMMADGLNDAAKKAVASSRIAG